jgi:hypothetical protein
MANRNYWLKMVGAADYPIEDRWIDQRADLLRGVRTPRQPRSIRRDDYLVYYSAGSQKLFAIARVSQDGENVSIQTSPGEGRWPYLIPVQVLLAIPQLALAPHWGVLGLESTSVMQKSYIEITEASYKLAWDAIVDRTRLVAS